MFHAWYARSAPHHHRDLTTPVIDEGTGPVVVCLHGFPTSSWDFEPLWPSLTANHRAIAHDLVGLGRASKPDKPLTVMMQADLVESILTARGITEAHILAHDLGDTVAQELLARQALGGSPVGWLSCVMLNGGLFPETHRPRLIQRLLISRVGHLVARLSTERTFRRNMRGVFGPDTPPGEAFLAGSWALLEADGGRQVLPRLIRYMDERKRHRDRWVQPLVDRVVPVRLINGSLDPVSGRHMTERYAELVPEHDIVHLPHLGHYPHVEDPDAVRAPVLDWLARHRS